MFIFGKYQFTINMAYITFYKLPPPVKYGTAGHYDWRLRRGDWAEGICCLRKCFWVIKNSWICLFSALLLLSYITAGRNEQRPRAPLKVLSSGWISHHISPLLSYLFTPWAFNFDLKILLAIYYDIINTKKKEQK